MAALKWSLTALTALLSFSISSSHKFTMPAGIAVPPKPIITSPTPVPAGPYPPGPQAPSGPTPPVTAGPYPPKPQVPSGPTPTVPAASYPPGPPIPAGPTPPVRAGPVPSGDVRVWPVSYKPHPGPGPANEASSSDHVVSPPKMVDDSELGAGCGGGGIPGFGGGCGCQPAAKNPYYCQPVSCGGSPGYGGSTGGMGFMIYIGENFPASGSDDEHKS